MGVKRVAIVVAFVVLLTISNHFSATAQAPPISQMVAQEYADNLLSTYHKEVWDNYKNYSTSDLQQWFLLYQPTGYSYNVTVLKWNETSNEYICFAFVPFISPSPHVAVASETLKQFLYPNLDDPRVNASASAFESYLGTIKSNTPLGWEIRQGAYGGSLGSGTQPLIWMANTTMLLADLLTSSAAAGDYIFRNDQRGFLDTIGKTQTSQTITSFGGIPISTSGGYLLLWIVGIAALVSIILQSVSWYFGSGRAFVVFLIDEQERKQVINEIRRLGKRGKPKSKNKKKQKDKHETHE